jgi:hypothetical protein
MRVRLAAISVLVVLLSACGSAYRDTSMFHDRIISEQPLPAEEYAVYSAALLEFPPGKTPGHDWLTVTGITIRPDTVDVTDLGKSEGKFSQDMLGRLVAAGDTVYLIESRFAESLKVAISPVLDTTAADWAPVRWHRVRDRHQFAGILSLSRVAFDDSRQMALVYGLWGTGTLGSGSPRVVLLRKQEGVWKILSSNELDAL